MTELVILGAGASADADIPTAREMSAAIASHLESRQSDIAGVLHFVVGGMLFHLGQTGLNPLAGIDVEELISAAELLAERQSLQISPFVSAWHPTVEWLDRPAGLRQRGFPSHDLARAMGSLKSRDMAKGIEEAIRAGVKPGDGRVYRQLAREMTGALVALVEIADPSKVDYLTPITARAKERGRLVVATLNYDRSIEIIAERTGCAVDTAIDSWASGRLSLAAEGIVLLKLHGSVDWVADDVVKNGRPMRNLIVRMRDKESDSDYVRPALVFGQRNKLQVEGPFLDLLLAFRGELEGAKHVTVIGYSFRDQHVNHYLAAWLNADVSRTMTVAGLGFGPTAP